MWIWNLDMIELQNCCTGRGARLRLEAHKKYYEHFVEKEMSVLEGEDLLYS